MDRDGLEPKTVWFQGWCCFFFYHIILPSSSCKQQKVHQKHPNNPPISLCLCVRVHVHVCVCRCAWGQHWMSSLIALHFSFGDIISHCAWSSLIRLTWMVSKPYRSFGLCIPVLGLQIYGTLLDFLLGGSKFRCSCLWSKHYLSSLAGFSSYSLECAIPGQSSQLHLLAHNLSKGVSAFSLS